MQILKDHFPMLRDRESILTDIGNSRYLSQLFSTWPAHRQNEFLDFCTGNRGMKILYDTFFKEVMSPELDSSRLEDFLSTILGESVRILEILPNDNTQVAAEHSLLITDIVISLSDGSIVNIELQKIGYAFPGERAACYSSDLLLRQYKRVRDKRQKNFSYKDIRPVITIILFEKSPTVFWKQPNTYIHTFTHASDTGLTLNLLQKYIFIPLDIFKENCHYNNRTKLVAWLTFLSSDNPEDICWLICEFPEFKPIYETLYSFCQNTERVMEMFSKELAIMDENTVKYMIDEMQSELDSANEKLNATLDQLDTAQKEYMETQKQLDSANEQLDSANTQLDSVNAQLDSANTQLDSVNAQLVSANEQLKNYEEIIRKLGGAIPDKQ